MGVCRRKYSLKCLVFQKITDACTCYPVDVSVAGYWNSHFLELLCFDDFSLCIFCPSFVCQLLISGVKTYTTLWNSHTETFASRPKCKLYCSTVLHLLVALDCFEDTVDIDRIVKLIFHSIDFLNVCDYVNIAQKFETKNNTRTVLRLFIIKKTQCSQELEIEKKTWGTIALLYLRKINNG